MQCIFISWHYNLHCMVHPPWVWMSKAARPTGKCQYCVKVMSGWLASVWAISGGWLGLNRPQHLWVYKRAKWDAMQAGLGYSTGWHTEGGPDGLYCRSPQLGRGSWWCALGQCLWQAELGLGVELTWQLHPLVGVLAGAGDGSDLTWQ